MSSKIDDARKEVIDFITKKLENENSVPWRDPCFNRAPINPISGTEYKGFNSMKLACVAMKRNYNDPRWVTFKQAKEKKYHLKKGSKGTTVEYYQYCKGELSDLEKEEVNVLPPIEAGASCFSENSTTDSEELRRLTFSSQA